MNRRPSSFSFRSIAIAAAAAGDSAPSMSFRPYFRGGRPLGSRAFSDRGLGPTNEHHTDFVSGDSHFNAVRDTNRSFRPNYHVVPPPPQYGPVQEYYGPVSQTRPPGPHPRPYRNPQQAGPAFGKYQPHRPQQMRRQFKPKPPDYRDWEHAKPGPPPHCDHFTVLSYNILADYLATDHWQKLYFHIPRYILDWNWRKKNICFELGLWSADILCFQEVDRFHDLEAELKPRGYIGIWKMRTGEAADGCAMFWRVSRFKLMHEESIEYNTLGLRNNVAQICVFESQNSLNGKDVAPTPSRSAECSNRVVVCNIHVLFNPKRGDVKLGQIRVLLQRAHAVSKLWDDAPVVICGDFNCTPKSPMYNFIREQKLDLLELPRDKISGQASAEIRPSWSPPYYGKDAKYAANNGQPRQGGSPLYSPKLACLDSSADSSSMASHSTTECSVASKTSEPCNGEDCGSKITSDLAPYDTTDNFASKSVSTQNISLHNPNGSLANVQSNTKPPSSPAGGANANVLSKLSYIHTKATGVGKRLESSLQTSSKGSDEPMEHSSLPDYHSIEFVKTHESTVARDSDKSNVEETAGKFFSDSPDVSSSIHLETVSVVLDNHKKPSSGFSCESLSADTLLNEKFEHLSLNDSVDDSRDELGDDHKTFLSELHDNAGESLFLDDLDSPFPNQKMDSVSDEIHSPSVENETVSDARYSFSSASTWTPPEIQLATGCADCKVMEHPLKLKSAYADIVNSPWLRDSSGEPLITSYHGRFLGTVDYIWCSEGLQTAKVLAPIPKDVMQQTQGFPTKKWGSDHIALVAQLAFTKDITPRKASE